MFVGVIVKDIATGARSLGFDSGASQIGHYCKRVTTAATFLRSQALSRGDGPRQQPSIFRNCCIENLRFAFQQSDWQAFARTVVIYWPAFVTFATNLQFVLPCVFLQICH